uniref:Uncharacterized protein n=1 Tax=Anguilla anguilla TaxID=7936 RepID=A0A0E9XRM5_ANGAN
MKSAMISFKGSFTACPFSANLLLLCSYMIL